MRSRISSALPRRPLPLCPSTHALLDVLAPAVYHTIAPASIREYATKSKPVTVGSTSVASTSADPAQRRPQRSRADVARARAGSNPTQNGAPTSQNPNRRRKPSPSISTAETPSAVDLLSRIRSAAPNKTSADGRRDPRGAAQAHNAAVQSLLRGVQGSDPAFRAAFVEGWIPLRNSGQAARVSTRDLEKVLMSTLGAEDPTWHEAVQELALWLAGDSDGRVLADWAWRTLGSGPDGCERIASLGEKIRQGAHVALREAPNGPDHAYRPVSHEGSGGRIATRRVPPPFFAAYVAARSLLRQGHPRDERPSFESLLPDFVHPTFPSLAPLLSRNELSQRLAALPVPGDGSMPETAAILPALRQVALAQMYYALPDRPGEGLLREIRSLFVRGQRTRAEELWQDVRVAVEDADLAWLDRSAWIQSGRRSVREQDDFEGNPTPDEAAETESNVPSPENVPATAEPSICVELPRAAFTQQIVARFLAGFVQAQDTEQANSIWQWLGSRDPPLTPGVACWTGLLRGYAARGNVGSVESAFAEMQRTAGIEPDYFAWMERVEAYFEAKQPDEAMQVAREMMRDRHVLRDLERDGSAGRFPLRMWNRLQGGLLAANRVREAEALLVEMERNGVSPTITTVNAFLKHYTRGTKPDLAGVSRVLQLVADKGLAADVYTFTMLLQALLAVGQRDASAKTIEIMQATGIMPTATTYGALIHSLASTGDTEHLRAATQLLDEMESKRMQTNEIVYTSLIQGYLRAGESSAAVEEASGLPQSVAAALTLKQRMERRGIAVPRAAYNVLLSTALAQQTPAGKDLAVCLFREMKQSRTALSRSSGGGGGGGSDAGLDANSGGGVTVADTWYILLDGFSNMNDGAMAGAILREMRESGFVPRSRALLRLIQRIQKGWEL
ncbi:hypothetical protein JCM3774_002747 [Rhodotorula dairenensis]